MRILHLSDCHLPRLSGVDKHGIDARATLAQLLADDGSPEGYTDALELIGRFARDRGIPQVYCPGNHDDRDAFTRRSPSTSNCRSRSGCRTRPRYRRQSRDRTCR